MLAQRDYSKIYKTYGGQRASGTAGTTKLVVVDKKIPQSLSQFVAAPNVTEQLLDLNTTTMDILGKGSKSVTQRIDKDLLACVVSGIQEIAVVSGWEYRSMNVGTQFANGGYLPIMYSPVDLFDETQQREAKVHHVTLNKGDCIYLPSHWWV